MIRVFNNTATYIDQGGGKRPGAFAMYLEPWHADVFDFLRMRAKKTPEEFRAKDLFYALWIPDLFMQRVESKGNWSLMCPRECPGLNECHGDAFVKLYTSYEDAGKARRVVPAMELWNAILESQFETGNPYMLAKDACNAKSNHKHMGTIKSSNLCCEIIQYTSKDEIAVCNLASIALSKFIKYDTEVPSYDFDKLYDVTYTVTGNLNKVIIRSDYPTPEAAYSNIKNRPIGIGVQGLADTFIMMRMPFDSPEAAELNKRIFECMYFAALDASCDLSKKYGPYASYEGSPASKGLLQHDLWLVGIKDDGSNIPENHPHQSSNLPWAALRKKISLFGLRNSLLLAPMPTASTAQILGNNEGCEPFTSNIYSREVLSGTYTIANPHLQKDLIKLGKWTVDLKDKIIMNGGSVNGIAEVPEDIQNLYKTVWEIKQKTIISMAADRGVYIDQSQSMNLHVSDPSYGKLTSLYFYAWRRGLKTLQYYFRQQTTVAPQNFNISVERAAQLLCSRNNPGACEACSS
jgi:ribonucleoside-diphosphate reductase alpha subunit